MAAEQIDTALIDAGEPSQNGMSDFFNGKFSNECWSMQRYKNGIDVKVLIEDFRRAYNEIQSHSSLGPLTPAEFKRGQAITNSEKAISKGRNAPKKGDGST